MTQNIIILGTAVLWNSWRKNTTSIIFTKWYDDDMMIVMIYKKKTCWSVVGTWCGKLSGTHKRPLRANCWEQWSCREKDENGGRKKVQLNFEWKPICKLWYKRCQRQCGNSSEVNKRLPLAIAWEQLRERSTKQNRLFTFIRSSVCQTSAVG